MARLPIYEQQTSAKTGRVTPQEMGAGVGQAMGQMGSVVADIGMKMKNREDRIEMTTRARDVDKKASELRVAAQSMDLTRTETVEQFENELRGIADEAVSTFNGTGDNKAAFREQIENQVYQYSKSVREDQIKAQYKMVNDDLDAVGNDLAIEVMYAPDMMDQILAKADQRVDYWKDVWPTTAGEDVKNSIRSTVISRGIDMLSNSEDPAQVAKAKALMQDPKYSQYLDPEKSGRLGVKIAVSEGKYNEKIAKREQNLIRWQALGVELTPQKVALLGDLEVGNEGEAILRYTQLFGPPTPKMAQQAFAMAKGNEENARDRIMMNMNNLDSMTDSERVGFIADVQKVFPSETRKNELGEWQVFPNPALRQVPQLARLMGVDFGGSSVMPADGGPSMSGITSSSGASESVRLFSNGQPVVGSPVPGSTVELRDSSGNTLGFSPVDERGMWSMTDKPRPGASGSWDESPVASGPARPAGETRIFQRLRSAGGVAGVKALAAESPIVGEYARGISGTEKALQDRPIISGWVNNTVAALRENQRYPAEGERKALMEEVGKLKDLWNNPEAAQDTAYGIFKTLQSRKEQLLKISNSTDLEVSVKNDARANVKFIDGILQNLSIVEADTDADLKKAVENKELYVGDVFFRADGRKRVLTPEVYDKLIGGAKK